MALGLSKANHIPAELADLVITEALRAVPGQEGTAWEPISLPLTCVDPAGPLKRGLRCDAAVRVPFHHDPASPGPWAVYLPDFQGEVTVSLNGVFLASSAWQQPSIDPFASAPLIISLPASLLRADGNALDVTLARFGVAGGFLGRVLIGPDESLRPHAQWRHFLMASLPDVLSGVQIAIGLSALVIWLGWRKETVYLLFGVMVVFHAMAALPTILGGAISDPRLVIFLHSTSRMVGGSLVYPFTAALLGRQMKVPAVAFLALPLASVICQLLLPLELYMRVAVVVFFPMIVLLLVSALVLVVKHAFTQWNVAAAVLLGGTGVILIFGVHDLVTVYLKRDIPQAMLGRYTVAAFMTAIGTMLIWRFAKMMRALDRVNARITRAVAAAEDSLRQSFAREQEQTRARILETERVRLMSDLHDGIAGQLVSILARCELRDDPREEIAHSVRAALTDLRLVVASLEDSGDDLAVMLALFRERIEPQLSAMGIKLTWRMAALPGVSGLHPGATLNIFRILQEAAINAARHSGSSTLDFEAVPSPATGHGIRLTLRDHGRGGAERRPGSYGLENMRRRAEALRADLRIISDTTGTTVILDLPDAAP